MAHPPDGLTGLDTCIPTFYFDEGHENRLILKVGEKLPLYLVSRGSVVGLFSGW